MTHPDRLVVKVGGSLYDHPNLKAGFNAWLAARPEPHVLIVPGGGDFAEAVRRLDTVHGLGEEMSHFLALMALAPASHVLADLIRVPAVFNRDRSWWFRPGPVILHHAAYLDDYQSRHAVKLPQTWDFTSDSIAACAAHDAGCELVLLKSTDIPPGLTWEQAAARGAVDPHFPTLVARHGLRVTAVNFRRVLDGEPSGPAPERRVSTR